MHQQTGQPQLPMVTAPAPPTAVRLPCRHNPAEDWLVTLSSVARAESFLPQERTTACRRCNRTPEGVAMLSVAVADHKKTHNIEAATCSRWPDTSLALNQHLLPRCPCCLPCGKPVIIPASLE